MYVNSKFTYGPALNVARQGADFGCPRQIAGVRAHQAEFRPFPGLPTAVSPNRGAGTSTLLTSRQASAGAAMSRRSRPKSVLKSPAEPERSCRLHRSAGSIIGTSGSRPEHRWVPLEVSRVAMRTPPGSPWTRRHILPRQERRRWRADKSKRRLQKTPCLLRGEKRVAAGGEESVGGPDEKKRRDSLSEWRKIRAMALRTRANLQNQAIGRLRKGCRSLGDGTVVRFPWIWMSSGESR